MNRQDLHNKMYTVIYTDRMGMQHKKEWKLIALDKDGFAIFEDTKTGKKTLIPKYRIDEMTEAD